MRYACLYEIWYRASNFFFFFVGASMVVWLINEYEKGNSRMRETLHAHHVLVGDIGL